MRDFDEPHGRSPSELLSRTSRTFALAIPLLPEPTRTTVSVAYLLFRVADTLEDASNWARDERVCQLSEFADLMSAPSRDRAEVISSAWLRRAPVSDHACLELLAEFPTLIERLDQLNPDVSRLVLTHVRRTSLGMRDTLALAKSDGQLRFRLMSELRAYCYAVAGIVGELLTAVFIHDAPGLSTVQSELFQHQAAFGEGLQLVNILKDEKADADAGRVYLPLLVQRKNVVALAREDLRRARLYIDALELGSAPCGFAAFTSFPAQLAEAALVRVEQSGPGAKIPRAEVATILQRIQRSAAAAHSPSAISGK
jgi:farnesyl-diphosphate farnesyltransferase